MSMVLNNVILLLYIRASLIQLLVFPCLQKKGKKY